MPLNWNATLATGNRQIDLQHQELFEIINALEAAHAKGRMPQILEVILPRLQSYVLFHFGTEEGMLQGIPPAHIRQHRKQHEEFTAWLATLLAQPHENIDLQGLIAYLQRWLVEHIMKADRELVRQLPPGTRRF